MPIPKTKQRITVTLDEYEIEWIRGVMEAERVSASLVIATLITRARKAGDPPRFEEISDANFETEFEFYQRRKSEGRLPPALGYGRSVKQIIADDIAQTASEPPFEELPGDEPAAYFSIHLPDDMPDPEPRPGYRIAPASHPAIPPEIGNRPPFEPGWRRVYFVRDDPEST
ncbi:MAG: hypothetical protein OXF57_00410 [Rhodospirillaceae bacterium]|nr:hypothetical protein [Rhodospirillaceae bacterium]